MKEGIEKLDKKTPKKSRLSSNKMPIDKQNNRHKKSVRDKQNNKQKKIASDKKTNSDNEKKRRNNKKMPGCSTKLILI